METIEFPMKDLRFIETKRSGYSLRKLLSHARRMAISSRIETTKYIVLLAVLATVGAIGAGIYFGILRLLNLDGGVVAGWTSLMVATTFLGGLILLVVSLGFEYLSSLLLQSQGKPTFFLVDRSSDAVGKAYFEGSTSESL
jgi:hypothetical protein